MKSSNKLLISDFDGTLLRSDGTISESVKNKIVEFKNAGGIFAIATGRLPEGIVKKAKSLGLCGPVATCHGSVILDIETKKVLFEKPMINKQAIKVCQAMEALNLHIHVYDLNHFYSNMRDEALDWYEQAVGTKAIVIDDMPMSVYLKKTQMPCYKVLAMVKAEDLQTVYNYMVDQKIENCTVSSGGSNLVEIFSDSCSKGTALEFLADYYHIPLKNTIAVGDNLNDIDMIEKAGLGIAVANANPSLKEKAFACLYSNNQDAIAHIIDEFGYTKD